MANGDPPTLGELSRTILRDREEHKRQTDLLREELRKTEQRLSDEIDEVKESLRWASRLVVGQFLILVVGLIVFVLGKV